MRRQYPKISIVTPSYNQGHFLEETILSVKNQDYPNFEHIVIDGGSTDNSVEILRKYEGTYNLRWTSEPDEGQADAVNKGFSLAEGEILGWVNSDDRYEPNIFSKVAEAFMNSPGVRVIYGDSKQIARDGRTLGIRHSNDISLVALLETRRLPQPSVFLDRRVIDEIGLLDKSLHYMLDGEYFLRAFLSYSVDQIVYLPAILAHARFYSETKIATGGMLMALEHMEVVQKLPGRHLLPPNRPDLYRKAWAGAYWYLALEQFKAGQYISFIVSVMRATWHSPGSFFVRLLKVPWLLKQKFGLSPTSRAMR